VRERLTDVQRTPIVALGITVEPLSWCRAEGAETGSPCLEILGGKNRRADENEAIIITWILSQVMNINILLPHPSRVWLIACSALVQGSSKVLPIASLGTCEDRMSTFCSCRMPRIPSEKTTE